MKEKFVDHNFSAASLALIETSNAILEEYRLQGYTLSLRQLYYQLVARDFVENTVKSYKRVGNLVSDARLAGLLDWSMIEDRGRESAINTHWETPKEILQSAAYSFKMDKWVGQTSYVEVFVEKDAFQSLTVPVLVDPITYIVELSEITWQPYPSLETWMFQHAGWKDTLHPFLDKYKDNTSSIYIQIKELFEQEPAIEQESEFPF